MDRAESPTCLKGGGAVELGGVHGVGGHVGDVGDELLQVVAGLLQVCGVDDDLNQLREHTHTRRPCLMLKILS